MVRDGAKKSMLGLRSVLASPMAEVLPYSLEAMTCQIQQD